MSFVFRRRLEIGKGLGVNVSTSGASLSFRNSLGSVSTSGFSVKTGIPGLSYRQSFGKKGSPIAGIIALIMLAMLLIPLLWNIAILACKLGFQVLIFAYWLLIVVPVKIAIWLGLTAKDYFQYVRTGHY